MAANYDMNSSYADLMNEKIQMYNQYLRKAEMQNRDSGGLPTKKEGEYYLYASKICSEIMNLNLSQRSVYNQWKIRKSECDEEIMRITKSVAPPAPKPEPEEPAPVTNSPPATKSKEVVSSTAGDFKTKNACKDVSAETISRWYKEKPFQTFEDVTGMENIKTMLKKNTDDLGWERIDSALKINPAQSYFFYGPPGTGKTFVIEAFASEMMEKGYKFIRLLGGDIHASLVGVAEKTVQIAFQEAIDNEPCIIFIDEVENVCVNRSGHDAEGHAKRLTVAFLEAYNLLRESGKRVIFLGATNYPKQVDEAMLDRATLVRVPLPSVDARAKYFARKLERLVIEDGFSVEEMAEATDNYSYRDLDKLKDCISRKIKELAISRYRIDNEDGTIDVEKTDIEASEAIAEGRVRITREMFEEAQSELLPSDKSGSLKELEAFEANVRRLNA